MIDYTLDARAIVFRPAHADAMGMGTYWFYPVDEGPVGRIVVEDGQGALLISSREGYFADRSEDLTPDRKWRITRRTFDATNAATDVVWSRTLDLEKSVGRMSLSDNGRWLGVHGWDFYVLDTESGDHRIQIPHGGLSGAASAEVDQRGWRGRIGIRCRAPEQHHLPRRQDDVLPTVRSAELLHATRRGIR